jgi:hypothetical protein
MSTRNFIQYAYKVPKCVTDIDVFDKCVIRHVRCMRVIVLHAGGHRGFIPKPLVIFICEAVIIMTKH